MSKRKRVSKQESIKQIKKLLRDGYATDVIISEICSKFHLSDRTVYNHLKEAKESHMKEQKELESKLMNERIRIREEALKRGLKTKTERDLEIQERIQYYQDVLDGNIKVSFILGQKVSKAESLPIDVVLMVQRAITDLWKELGKRLGEYEPNKIEHTGEVKINPIFYLDDK